MSEELGIQGFTAGDQRVVAGSRFSVVRGAIFANPYQNVWGAKGNAPLERLPVTFMPLIKGMLPGGGTWQFLAAAKRVLASDSDLRWGPDGKGYRRLLHTNGICMTGLWEITEDTPYTGYFRKGSRGLIITRYSTCCTETRRGNTRSLSMIGRIYPTTDPNHPEPLPTACFITQEDIGGEDTRNINDAKLTSDSGTTHGLPIKERRDITNWKKIGTMTFDAAVVSFNGDHVFHVNHPAWREDRNDPRTVVKSKV